MIERRALQLLIFIVAAVLMALGMDRNLAVYDEGLILTGAMRVAAGDIPHRDFYANYGPGQFYAIAGLFKLFGEYAIAERAYDTLVRAGIVAMCYGLAAGVAARGIALAAAATVFLWLYAVGYYGYTLLPVTLLSLAAAAIVQPSLARARSAPSLAAAGACVGLAALIRYDAGFMLFVALAAVLALSAALRSGPARPAARDAAAMLVPYVLGTSAVFLGAAACYLAVAPLGAFIHDIFIFSVPNYARTRSMPFPSLRATISSIDNVSVYLPIVLCALAAWSLGADRSGMARRARDANASDGVEARRDWLVATFALITAAFYLKGLVRPHPVHLIASIVASIILLAVMAVRAWRQGSAWRVAVAILGVLAMASATFAAVTTFAERNEQRATVLDKVRAVMHAPAGRQGSWCSTPPELARIKCLLLDLDREQAAQFVAQNTRPDERIFVGLTRHDKIFVNDVAMYFAAGRMPATRWHHFDPGLQTSERIQRAIIAELEAGGVRYVILESTWDLVPEPNESADSSGVHLLDQYLLDHYGLVRTFGEIFVLTRK